MGLMRHIHRLNAIDPTKYHRFMVGWRQMGLVVDSFAAALKDYPAVFSVTDRDVALTPSLNTPQARSLALAEVGADLVRRGVTPPLRDEIYPANNAFHDEPEFYIDRALVPYLGLRAYGVHVNGYTPSPDGPLMWLAKRAEDRKVEPGKLDNMVAGGQPAHLSLKDNLIKECAEEADIPEPLARQCAPVGAVTYHMESDNGVKPDCMFCFDLELPEDFTPRPMDGEVEAFFRLPAAEALDLVRTSDRFKFNVNLVIIDFALRHGLIDPDKDPLYEALIVGLRAGDKPFG